MLISQHPDHGKEPKAVALLPSSYFCGSALIGLGVLQTVIDDGYYYPLSRSLACLLYFSNKKIFQRFTTFTFLGEIKKNTVDKRLRLAIRELQEIRF